MFRQVHPGRDAQHARLRRSAASPAAVPTADHDPGEAAM
jgi:hypothetical protein